MFKKTSRGNFILEGDGFYVSFLPHGVGPLAGTSLGTALTGETALVNKNLDIPNPYFILNGDFRKEYEGLVKQGWSACYRFFTEQWDEHGCHLWSHEPCPDQV